MSERIHPYLSRKPPQSEVGLEENDYCTISVMGGGGRHWEEAGKKGKLKLGRAPGRVVKGDPVSCSNFKNHTTTVPHFTSHKFKRENFPCLSVKVIGHFLINLFQEQSRKKCKSAQDNPGR